MMPRGRKRAYEGGSDEDSENAAVRRRSARLRMRRNRANSQFREAERKRDRLAHAERRENEVFRCDERQRDAAARASTRKLHTSVIPH